MQWPIFEILEASSKYPCVNEIFVSSSGITVLLKLRTVCSVLKVSSKAIVYTWINGIDTSVWNLHDQYTMAVKCLQVKC